MEALHIEHASGGCKATVLVAIETPLAPPPRNCTQLQSDDSCNAHNYYDSTMSLGHLPFTKPIPPFNHKAFRIPLEGM
mgnify:CR=1 FL=1